MSDKRSVSTDALATLGMIIDDSGRRDAIHLAVEPVVAGERLVPGQDIGIREGKAYNTIGGTDTCYPDTHLGIVDPFLSVAIQPGQRFWLIVYPRQITSLRHVWEHPEFEHDARTMVPTGIISIGAPIPLPSKREESEAWLRDFCHSSDCPSYHIVMDKIERGLYGDEDYFHFNDYDAHGPIPSEFWEHAENVIGRKLVNKPDNFSCSC